MVHTKIQIRLTEFDSLQSETQYDSIQLWFDIWEKQREKIHLVKTRELAGKTRVTDWDKFKSKNPQVWDIRDNKKKAQEKFRARDWTWVL